MRGTRSSCSLQGERTGLASALGSANRTGIRQCLLSKAAKAEARARTIAKRGGEKARSTRLEHTKSTCGREQRESPAAITAGGQT